MGASLLELFDLVTHAEVLEQRLAAAAAALAEREGLVAEKSWLEAGRHQLEQARAGIGDLMTRVLRLADLAPMRGERGRALQGVAVDAVEGLFAGIAAAGGERSPLLEAIFRNLKPPAMRRTGRDEFEHFCAEIEKRLESSYVKRMLADETYVPAAPAVERLRDAFTAWRDVLSSEPLGDEEAAVLEAELAAFARRVELPGRQAVLLAQAALITEPAILEESGILDRPRRRARSVIEAS